MIVAVVRPLKHLRAAVALLLFSVCAATAQAANFSVVHTFTGPDGEYPSGLVQDTAGNLYGTTLFGGNFALQSCDFFGCGVVFEVVPESKTFNVLYEFTGQADGELPDTGVIHSPTGALYGITSEGQQIFRISPQGADKTVYTFSNSLTGDDPQTGLTADPDGNLYGMTSGGGDNNAGVVYEFDHNGVYSVLHSFDATDGLYPGASLLYRSNGNLFGTTSAGGALNNGVVFKLQPGGVFTILHNFNGSDGSASEAPLIQDQQGNLYGSTTVGGSGNNGVIFKLDPAGTYSVLYNFTGGADGGYPSGPLVRDQETGALYGTAQTGGGSNGGVIFQLDAFGNETVLYSFSGLTDGKTPASGIVARKLGNGLLEFFGTTVYGGGSCIANPNFACGTVFRFTLN